LLNAKPHARIKPIRYDVPKSVVCIELDMNIRHRAIVNDPHCRAVGVRWFSDYKRPIGQFLGITPESVTQVRDYTMVLGIPCSRPACLAAASSGLCRKWFFYEIYIVQIGSLNCL